MHKGISDGENLFGIPYFFTFAAGLENGSGYIAGYRYIL